ncbi:MAG TPA: hypothetical protein VF680_16190 [Allosphingosinicella sp.]|jgi:hypothetical protein
MDLHKDEALDRLAESGNVAQFVAFRPHASGLMQSFSRLQGFAANHQFQSIDAAAEALLTVSADGAVNVRSYLPDAPRSREFVYGITSVAEAVAHVERLAAEGLHLILNETVEIKDGGVSGVAQGDIIEFAPDDTPRAVEKPDVASLPRDLGIAILKTVYGFAPDLPGGRGDRIEFSIHPRPRGWRGTNTLLWEVEPNADIRDAPVPRWPNRFSRHLGDKAFGLLVADALGIPVPETIVVARRVAPFRFGQATGSGETWIRTCPREPQPGLFTTARGWRDPFAMLAAEDPDDQIASVLAQAGVPPRWSGGALVGQRGRLIVEGRHGEGDLFMLGAALPEALPAKVEQDVRALHARLADQLGPVRIEWVHDGAEAWIVQLHIGATDTSELAIVPGEAVHWTNFEVSEGLNALRDLLSGLPVDAGVVLHGEIGLTSHIADVVRKWGQPARMQRPV